MLAAVDRDGDAVVLGEALHEHPLIRVVHELQVERRPVDGRIAAELVAADVEGVRVALGDPQSRLPGGVEHGRRDLEVPPPTSSSYFVPMITGADRKPRSSVRSPIVSLSEKVPPGATSVSSRSETPRRRFVIRSQVRRCRSCSRHARSMPIASASSVVRSGAARTIVSSRPGSTATSLRGAAPARPAGRRARCRIARERCGRCRPKRQSRRRRAAARRVRRGRGSRRLPAGLRSQAETARRSATRGAPRCASAAPGSCVPGRGGRRARRARCVRAAPPDERGGRHARASDDDGERGLRLRAFDRAERLARAVCAASSRSSLRRRAPPRPRSAAVANERGVLPPDGRPARPYGRARTRARRWRRRGAEGPRRRRSECAGGESHGSARSRLLLVRRSHGALPVGIDAELVRSERERLVARSELDGIVRELGEQLLELRDGLTLRETTDVDPRDVRPLGELARRTGERQPEQRLRPRTNSPATTARVTSGDRLRPCRRARGRDKRRVGAHRTPEF